MRGEAILKRIERRWSRIRHFRGHGIHSPYIYRLYREAFMPRKLASNGVMYEVLSQSEEVSERCCKELQTIFTTCGYKDVAEICVLSINDPKERVLEGVKEATKSGTTVVILTPQKGRKEEGFIDQIVDGHSGTTIRRSEYLLIFNNHLPKQHFQL